MLLVCVFFSAADYTVNTTADTIVSADSNCSLREAIDCFNGAACDCGAAAGTGVTTIHLGPSGSVYTLSLTGAEDGNASGDLDVNPDAARSLLLEGNGSTVTTSVFERVFDLLGSNIDQVYLHNLTLAAGDEAGGGGCIRSGGSRLSSAGVHLLLDNVTVFGCNAGGDGGAILYDTINGRMNLVNSAVHDNAGFHGGGIAIYRSTVSVTSSSIRANQAAGVSPPGYGGGILYTGTNSLIVTGSTVSNNHARVGGGIAVKSGTLSTSTTSIANNTVDNDGGGVAAVSLGSCILGSGTTVSGNNASQGGGLFFSSDCSTGQSIVLSAMSIGAPTGNSAAVGGGIYFAGCEGGTGTVQQPVTFFNVSVNGNQASGGAGGAIYSTASNGGGGYKLQALGMTLQDNKATNGDGGAIAMQAGVLAVTGAAIIANQASGDGGALWLQTDSTLVDVHFESNQATRGGGVFNGPLASTIERASFLSQTGDAIRNEGSLTLKNVTLSGNDRALFNSGNASLLSCSLLDNASDGIHNTNGDVLLSGSVLLDATCTTTPGARVVSNGSNLRPATLPTGCTYVTDASDVLTATPASALFGPLQPTPSYYTQTRGPLFGSPQHPGVNTSLTCAAVDARNATRSNFGVCDIGAQETDRNLALTLLVAPTSGLAGDYVTADITVSNAGVATIEQPTWRLPIPAGMTYFGMAGVPGGWTCDVPAIGATGVVACTGTAQGAGSLPFGGLGLRISPRAPLGVTLQPQLIGGSQYADFDLSNNTSTQNVYVSGGAVVWYAQVSRTPPEAFQPLGTTMSYNLSFTNNGTSSAVGAILADTIDPRLQSVTRTCHAAGGVVCGASGAQSFTVDPGYTATWTVSGTISPTTTDYSTMSYSASVAASGYSNGGTGATSTSFDIVPPVTQLTANVVVPTVAHAGTDIVFTAQDGNGGGVTEPGYTGVLTVGSTATTFVGLSNGPGCTANKVVGEVGPVTVTCTGSVPVRALADRVSVTLHVLPATPQFSALPTAYVLTGTYDADGAGGPMQTIQTDKRVDIGVSASATALVVTVVATNTGPSDSDLVTLTVLIPPGATLLSFVAPAHFMCLDEHDRIYCYDGALAAGATESLLLSFAAGSFTVSATVSSQAPDPNASNDMVSLDVALVAPPVMTAGPTPGPGSATGDTAPIASADPATPDPAPPMRAGCGCKSAQADVTLLLAALTLVLRRAWLRRAGASV